jgi:hypothetical protein
MVLAEKYLREKQVRLGMVIANREEEFGKGLVGRRVPVLM